MLDSRDDRRWRNALSQMPLALTIETQYGPINVIQPPPRPP